MQNKVTVKILNTLKHSSNLFMKVVMVIFLYRNPIKQDLPASRLVEVFQKVDAGAFPSTARPYQGHYLAWAHRERHSLDQECINMINKEWFNIERSQQKVIKVADLYNLAKLSFLFAVGPLCTVGFNRQRFLYY